MKKLLAFLLVLSMLLAMIVIPVSANEGAKSAESAATKVYNFSEEEIEEQVESVMVGSTTYKVVWTPQQFLRMDADGNYATYILGKDLDFKGIDLTPVYSTESTMWAVVNNGDKLHHFTLEGNGCTLDNMVLNFTEQKSALFSSATYRTSIINHLTINATCNFTANYCGVLFGGTAGNSTEIKLNYVTIDADVKKSAQGTGVFIGQNNATKGVTMTGCIAKGNWDFTTNSAQAAGFIAQNQNKATFNKCSIDANIVSMNNRKGGFVGQQYATTALTFTDCTASGNLYEVATTAIGSKWLAGYVGAIYKENTVTFTNCKSDVKISGESANSGFVGGFDNGDKTPATGTVTFTNCEFSGTGVSVNNIAGLVGEVGTATTINIVGCKTSGNLVTARGNVKNGFAGGNMEKSKATIDAASVDNAKVTRLGANDDDLLDGRVAYELCEAQSAIGMTAHKYGQKIGTDEYPKLDQATVYKLTTAKGATVYSNNAELGVLEAPADGGARVHYQLKTSDETKSFRALIDVSEAYLGEITSMKLTVAFKTSDTTSKVLTVENEAIEMFYAVVADGDIYQTADGRVLLAVAVEGITADWTGDVKIELVTTGSANAVAAYSVTSVSNAFGG